MSRPRLLDLFCGAGGAASGYHHAGFDITGVDSAPQPHYAFDFVHGDALEYLAAHGHEYDAIHASPPCQAYVQRNKNLVTRHPKYITPLREMLHSFDAPHVIENVPGAPLDVTVTLCGTMFDLLILRHRIFEASFHIPPPPRPCDHWGTVAAGDFAAIYAFGGKGHRGHDQDGNRIRGASPVSAGPDWNDAMGIDWMTRRELTQSIPPAYTEYIGRWIHVALQSRCFA